MNETLGEKIAQTNAEYLAKLESPISNDFTKIVRFATAQNYGRTTAYSIYAKITYVKGKLYISGVEGPFTNGNCVGSCGQIVLSLKYEVALLTPAPGWTTGMITKFLTIWDEWHLNDMHAGCEHQRANWDTGKLIELRSYTWTSEFFARRRKAEEGELTTKKYKIYRGHAQMVKRLIFTTKPIRWESESIKVAIELGLIKEDVAKRESKAAGWVDYRTHPEGLLSKPCEVCDYGYGTKWLHEDVPTDVLEWLQALPDADRQPAWI